MITDRKLICGTRDELIDYFYFVGKDDHTSNISTNIEEQLNNIDIGTINYVHYLKPL